MKFITQ
jgi:hypothetical protein